MKILESIEDIKMQDLIKKIERWAIDRELDKTAEEMAELIIGISKDNIEGIKDSIGDVFVTLVIGNMIDEKLDIEKYYKYAKEDLNRRDIEDDKRAKIFGLAQDMMEVIRDEYYYDTLFHTLVDLVEIAEIHNLKFTDCVESAYDEIKDRKGKTIDGCFVKAEDL